MLLPVLFTADPGNCVWGKWIAGTAEILWIHSAFSAFSAV